MSSSLQLVASSYMCVAVSQHKLTNSQSYLHYHALPVRKSLRINIHIYILLILMLCNPHDLNFVSEFCSAITKIQILEVELTLNVILACDMPCFWT